MCLVGCATTAPQNFSEYNEGEWDGKVLVHDKKESKSAIVNVKVKAVNGERLRIDVTSTMGTHLASLLVVGDNLEYLDMNEKSVLRAKANRVSLRDLLRVPIEPQALYSVFFDKMPAGKNWVCIADAQKLVKSCHDSKTGLKIDWISRDGRKRTIGFEHTQASVQMSLFDFESKVKDPEKAFTLKVPSSFKVKKM